MNDLRTPAHAMSAGQSQMMIPNIRIMFFVHANPCAYIALLIAIKCGSHGDCF